MNLYANLNAATAMHEHRHLTRTWRTPTHWFANLIGSGLVTAGAKLMDDPIALHVAAVSLEERAHEGESLRAA